MALALGAFAMLGGGCMEDASHIDSAFYNWDNRKIHCPIDIDSEADVSMSSIDSGLDRAQSTGEVFELYTHDPGNTVSWSTIDTVLQHAQARGLAFVTFDDIIAGNKPATGALSLSFDDAHEVDWVEGLPMYAMYSAKLTFWIAYYNTMGAQGKADVKQLGAAGHSIEAHTVKHQRAPEYVEQFGLDAWMNDEVQPSIDELVADGFTVDAFAYPFGARTDETDDAVGKKVKVIRSVAYTWESPATDPCPY